MKIVFIRSERAYLPEIDAYQEYFTSKGHEVIIINHSAAKQLSAIKNLDVEWHFIGRQMSNVKAAKIKIHEYASNSMPPFIQLKNQLKKWINCYPDLRIFPNQYVYNCFNFSDRVPYLFRQMGVRNNFLSIKTNKNPDFDFVYCGSLDKHRKINLLLQKFTSSMKNNTILIIGKYTEEIKIKFSRYTNIFFAGYVPYQQIPSFLQQAKYGINFIPDIIPFNQQISTKILEYCAVGLPVITTDYAWVNNFEKSQGGKFYYLDKYLHNFSWEEITKYHYTIPAMQDFSWDKIIARSGIEDFLQNTLKDFS